MMFSRAVCRVVVAAAVVLVGLYLLLPPLSRTAAFRTGVQRALASTAGFDVVLASIAVGYDLSIAAAEVSVAAPQQQPFFRARHVEVGLAPRTLLTGRVAMVRVDEPHLFVDRLPPSSAAAGPQKGGVHGLWTAKPTPDYTGPASGKAEASAERRAAVSRKIRISREDLKRVVKEALEDNPEDETAKRMQWQLLKNPEKQVWEFEWIFDVGE